MKTFTYLKFYNSDSTTANYWDKLSKTQKRKLKKIAAKLEQDLIKFKDNRDIAYSMLMHLLTNKIELVEVPTNAVEIVPKQVSSNEKW